jgi:hypothetical protein
MKINRENCGKVAAGRVEGAGIGLILPARVPGTIGTLVAAERD